MTIQEIEKMSTEDIAKKVNEEFVHCSGGLSSWQSFYANRKQDETNEELKKINVTMLKISKIMLWLTVANIIIAGSTIMITILG